MPVVNPEKLMQLQHAPNFVRNLCVLAHVDHGKTSLTDSLIATNGIISPKQAGRIRYLDSRPDEQIRGITMESSAISLFFSLLRRTSSEAVPEQEDYLVNLIDSPGHVDFSSEVSTASRLCDGALVLVDAVEGVCSQTVAVLRQSWIEHLKPVLVINKMDRLIVELKMSPGEAYIHLAKLIEQVNAIMGSFFQGERMEDDMKWRERADARLAASAEEAQRVQGKRVDIDDHITEESLAQDSAYEEKDDENIYFEPDKGNVIFSSAIDGWAFTVKQFAGFYEKKIGIKRAVLEKVLWGDFYLDPKTKRVLSAKHLKGRHLKPMFVQLVLDSVWAVYDAVTGGDKGKGDVEKVEKITKSLSIHLPAYLLRSRDPRAILTALFAAWIPLSTAVLVTAIEQLPSPITAQAARMPEILDSSPGSSFVSMEIRKAMQGLKKSRSNPLVAFVSKMVAIPEKELPEHRSRTGGSLSAEEARELGRKKRAEIARAQALTIGESPDVAEMKDALGDCGIGRRPQQTPIEEDEEQTAEPERLIGFARLFAGTLEVGDEVYVLSPKFTPANPHATPEPQKVTITALYLLMGRSLEPLTSVPAGVVFGIAGLEGHILKSGTLCSQLEGGVNLAGLSMAGQPIVRVALEPKNPADLGKMVTGLRMLQQSDPCAAYEVLENGEHVMVTAGELHLERCLKDLRERFARCDIQAGAPIVPYRESIVNAAEMRPPRDKDLPRGSVLGETPSKQVNFRLRVRPLPAEITDFLVRNASVIRDLYAEHADEEQDGVRFEDADGDAAAAPSKLAPIAMVRSLDKLREGLQEVCKGLEVDRDMWLSLLPQAVAFGPRRSGPNLLIDKTPDGVCMPRDDTTAPTGPRADTLHTHDFADKLTYAFQLATAHGPLCQEPLQGVAVVLESVALAADPAPPPRAALARLTGETIRAARDAVHRGLLDWSPRLQLAMYSCAIQASTEVLGRVYGVVTRRRGRILSEALNEGTPFFSIVATLPVAESFGFADEMRKRTSGAASPQLVFCGFETLDEDPFWVPSTEEELEDLGELADRENVAKRYIDGVRKRKGLYVAGKKLVADAEKQKTLKR